MGKRWVYRRPHCGGLHGYELLPKKEPAQRTPKIVAGKC